MGRDFKVKPLLGANRDVMLLCFISIWLQFWALSVNMNRVPDLASLSGKGLITKKRLGSPSKVGIIRILSAKKLLTKCLVIFHCIYFFLASCFFTFFFFWQPFLIYRSNFGNECWVTLLLNVKFSHIWCSCSPLPSNQNGFACVYFLLKWCHW